MSVSEVLLAENTLSSQVLCGNELDKRICHKAKLIFTSPLFWTFTLSSVGIGFLATPLYSFSLIFPLMIGGVIYYNSKEIFYELSIVFICLRNCMGSSWWNEIDNNVMISAIPFKNKDHQKKLKNLGVNSILSVVEPFEFERETIFSKPVKPLDWKKLNIEQKQIPNQDFTPLSIADLHVAADYIEQEVQKGNKILVHCTAGKGRSVMSVICYYIKHKGFSAKEAIKFVTEKRASWLNYSQRQRIFEFESALKLTLRNNRQK